MEILKSLNLAEVEISYKSKIKPEDRIKIKTSRDSFNVFRDIWNPNSIEYREEMYMLMLNIRLEMLGYAMVSKGGLNSTLADVRIILQTALLSNATSVIIAHNHPSGSLQASRQDKELTEKLKNGAKLLDIQLADHIIITADNYLSFADEGML